MAINAPIVRPDPVGNFLESFRVIDTSARDQQRLEMQRRQMEENAVQRARENKANDFNLMLKAVSRQDDLEQRAKDNEFRRQQLGLNQYSAITSRYNALTPSSRSSRGPTGTYDPLGLSGGTTSTTPAAPEIPSSMALPGDPALPMPSSPAGGIDLPMSSSGPQAPLVDSSLPMDGPDGPDATLLTPADLVPPPAAPVDNTPPVDATGIPMSPAAPAPAGPPDYSAMLPPPVVASPSPGMPDFVGPVQSVPSLSAAPIDQGTNNNLLALKRTQDELAAKEGLAKANASKVRTFLGQVAKDNPNAVPAYIDELAKRETEAIQVAGQKAEVEAKAKEAEVQKQLITKRQQTLRVIGGDLDKILPEGDRQALLTEVADPTSAAADQRLAELAVYNKIRQQRRLTHQSNGLETAAQVARAGAALETKEAAAERQSYNAYNVISEEIKSLEGKATRTEGEQKRLDALMNKQISELPQARMWEARQATFEQAVRDDTRISQLNPQDTNAPTLITPPTPGPGPITPPATPPGINLRGDQMEQMIGNAKRDRAYQFWNAGKMEAIERARLDRATDQELQDIVRGTRPAYLGDVNVADPPTYAEQLAKSIAPAFIMPEGQGNKEITGRSGEVTVEDFLREGARAELARRAGSPGALDPSKQARLDKVRSEAKLIPR